MSSWNLYFLLKLYLYYKGAIDPIWWANLALIVVLILPFERRWVRGLRLLVGLAVAIPLFYHESSLPPFAHAIQQFGGIARFDASYLRELVERFVPPRFLWGALLAVVAYYVVNRWVRVSSFVLIAFIAIPLANSVRATWNTRPVTTVAVGAATAKTGDTVSGTLNLAGGNYEAALADFRKAEAGRRVVFAPADPRADAKFDIIMIHICSLSWDDLKATKNANAPLMSQFDYLFTNFSGAVSYSGPAAIRLLRADCGQEPHKALYQADPPYCHIFADLQKEGYTTQIALNHDGRFDDFIGDVTRNLGVPGVKKMSLEGVPVALRAFDGSPVRDDLATLDKWWSARKEIQGPVALYYNTITLHDGNRIPDSSVSSMQSYPLRLKKLLSEIQQFESVVKASGRKAVMVFIPEHGAAYRGEPGQIAGLRDIPTPKIINIPVGVKLINFAGQRGPTQVIKKPSSYLALAQLIANMVANSPFAGSAPPLAQYSSNLPDTAMVGENEGIVTLRTKTGYAERSASGNWTVHNE